MHLPYFPIQVTFYNLPKLRTNFLPLQEITASQDLSNPKMASMTDSKRPESTFPFLSLPRKLRGRIYNYTWLDTTFLFLQETPLGPTPWPSRLLLVAAYANDDEIAQSQIKEWSPPHNGFAAALVYPIWQKAQSQAGNVRPMFPLVCHQVYDEAKEQFLRCAVFALPTNRRYVRYARRIPIYPVLRSPTAFPHLSNTCRIMLSFDFRGRIVLAERRAADTSVLCCRER